VYLIGSDGRIRWSKDLPFDVLGSPVMADVNGDGHPDVIAGDGDWNVYGWDAAGTQTFFFHTDSFVKNAPVVADFNGDGMNEVVVASGVQNDMPKLWELATSARAGGAANPWPMFRGSAARIGASTPVKVVPPRYNFDENLLLANPGSTPAHATVTLQLPAGAPVVVPFDIAPHARVTFPVDEQVPNSAVSAKVDSDQPISAERTMFFNYQGRWDGGHTTHGAVAPATDWFLAEGYTAPNFDTYVLVQNPNLSAVDVTVTLMKPGGETRDEILHLGPQSRSTLVVKNVPGFDSSEVSFRVHGTGPIVVERSMYFDYDQKTGGHDALGVAQLANQWFLAEGYTANSFDTYVLVANPNDTVAHVTYTFLRPSGPPVQAGRDIAPHSRGTIKVDDVPGLDATDVSTRVDSDQPIAVERAMYFDYYGKTGGHDAEGVTGLGSDWYLAEGSTQPGFDTYVLLANPNASDAAVDIEYSREDGTVSHQALTVPANTRQTVHLNDVVPGAGVATHVHVRNGVGIAVERAMYFTYLGTWNGGTDAQAMPAPSTVWDFAEGYTGQ
jgi:hypothetical protein